MYFPIPYFYFDNTYFVLHCNQLFKANKPRCVAKRRGQRVAARGKYVRLQIDLSIEAESTGYDCILGQKGKKKDSISDCHK